MNAETGREPSLAIRTLLQDGRPSRPMIDAFIAAHEFPLLEGDLATFVWRGSADALRLRHFIYALESDVPFLRVQGTDFWHCSLTLPRGSRIEYKIDVIRSGNHKWIRDPCNPRTAIDPFGANSVCATEGYVVPDFVELDDETRPGSIEEHWIEQTPFGERRRVDIYLPARMRATRRYPLLIVHDGGDYLRFAALKEVLDNLIHRGEVQPLIVALTYPGDRLVEYPDDPRHTSFIAETLLPWLSARYTLLDDPDARVVMGASFGGVAALSVAWRYPGVFGGLLSQSGSFAFTDIGKQKRGPAFEPVVRFVNAFRAAPGRPVTRAFISCGQYESLIYENRSMVPFLQAHGVTTRFVEARDGHNWENWRDRLQTALSWLFPGPLWMVYE
jgi:enterochelin esterase-like enzyme